MRYRDVVTPGGGLDSLPGFHVKSEKCPHSTHFLKWEEGTTIFRAYPAVENNEILGMRYSEMAGDYTPWFVAVRMVKMFGVNDKFTCLTHVKGKPFSARGPIDYFADAMEKAVGKSATNARDFPKEWEDWLKGSKGKGAKISEVGDFGLIQGMLFENGKKMYVKDGQPDPLHPVLLCLAKSARWQLGKLCDAEVEGYNGHPEDWSRRFKIGDIVSPEGGRLLQFYTVPRTDESNARYGFKVLDSVVRLSPDLIKNEWETWENLLVFLSEAEQMELLLRSFPNPPLDFVFSGSSWEDLLPAKVKGAFKSSQSVPGFQAAGVYGLPAAGYPQLSSQPLHSGAQPPFYAPPQQPINSGSLAPPQQPINSGSLAPPVYAPPQQPVAQPPVYAPSQQPTQPPVYAPPQQHAAPLQTHVPPSQQPVAPPQTYVPPPPPPGYPAAAAPAIDRSPYANLTFGVDLAAGKSSSVVYAPPPPAQPSFQPPTQPSFQAPAQPSFQAPAQPVFQAPPQHIQPPQQPTGDPSAVSGIFINAMEDLRTSQANARQRRETPNG